VSGFPRASLSSQGKFVQHSISNDGLLGCIGENEVEYNKNNRLTDGAGYPEKWLLRAAVKSAIIESVIGVYFRTKADKP
jgi:hypothetical protein